MSLTSYYHSVPLSPPRDDVAEELRQGLSHSPKRLPSKWLYDAAGSELFEQICDLPEYYPTRTESNILRDRSRDIVNRCPQPLSLVELGSGSSRKTGQLVRACLERQNELTYYAIDISEAALEMAAEWMTRDFANLQVIGLIGEFAAGLDYLREQATGPQLIAFLGSTIGNMSRTEIGQFFQTLRKDMVDEDRFLLGFDLRKDPAILVPAYDDRQGITAQFNLNTLVRLNREFEANFDLDQFEHRAVFNDNLSRIEMHLVSKVAQTVSISGLNLQIDFQVGETIHTENSYKYSFDVMQEMLKECGLTIEANYFDDKHLFCLALIR